MVGKIFQTISPSADKVETRRIGEVDNEMDPVGLVYPADKSIAAVVFPIAESLKQVCRMVRWRIGKPRMSAFIYPYSQNFDQTRLMKPTIQPTLCFWCNVLVHTKQSNWVIFLGQIRSLASSDENRPLLLINPQWRNSGQVVSDFGFGPWRRSLRKLQSSSTIRPSCYSLCSDLFNCQLLVNEEVISIRRFP